MPTLSPSNDPDKYSVAKDIFDTQWKELHWRRDTEQKIVVWVVGFLGVILALTYGKVDSLTIPQKIVFSVFPTLVGIPASVYLFENSKTYRENANVVQRISRAMGCYILDHFVEGSLYPKRWDGLYDETAPLNKTTKCYIVVLILSTITTIIGICLK